MLKTHMLLLLLVYFPTIWDSAVSHDHLDVEPLQIVTDRAKKK